jgi:thymidylate synthase
VQLAELQGYVAGRLNKPEGKLTMIVKTAHIYAPEIAHMTSVVKTARA